MSAPLLLSVDNVWVTKGSKTILQDISLSLNAGQITTIIGPNGAGKTTLVKVILGSTKPSKGQVSIHKKDLRIGYIPQRLKMNPNIPLGTKDFLMLQNNGKESPRFQELCTQLGVDKLMDRRLYALSGGELQRVLLLNALMVDPDLLILDEPDQGIDIEGQQELYRLLDHACLETTCGILLISHDLHLVIAKSHTVYCMNTHICCHGHPNTIQDHDTFKALFGKNVRDATLAVYEHHHDHRHS